MGKCLKWMISEADPPPEKKYSLASIYVYPLTLSSESCVSAFASSLYEWHEEANYAHMYTPKISFP